MSNIATMISQSHKLVELGLDPNTADMYYPYFGAGQYGDTPRVGFPIEYSGGRDIPAWSLTALLEVMPQENEPELVKSVASGQYFVHGYFDLEKPTYMTKDYASPVDAAYEMVCWLLEQGLIKKGGNQ